MRIVDRRFDLLNTSSPFGKGFERHNFVTITQHKNTFEESINYLVSLKTNSDIPLVGYRRKTCFLGFVLPALSIKELKNISRMR